MSKHMNHDGYTDDMGEMEGIGLPVADFLPPPAAFTLHPSDETVALSLSPETMAFFNEQAAKHRRAVSEEISALLNRYAAEQNFPH